MTRRELLQSLAAAPLAARAFAQSTPNADVAYGATTIPAGIRSRMVTGVNGITMHALEAGFESAGRPAVLLSTAFPSSPTAGAR